MRTLLRNTLDDHARTNQTAQQQRTRHYDDELQCYDRIPPEDAPQWAYVEQPDMVYDTEYSEKTEKTEEDNYVDDDEELEVVLTSQDNIQGSSKSDSFMQED